MIVLHGMIRMIEQVSEAAAAAAAAATIEHGGLCEIADRRPIKPIGGKRRGVEQDDISPNQSGSEDVKRALGFACRVQPEPGKGQGKRSEKTKDCPTPGTDECNAGYASFRHSSPGEWSSCSIYGGRGLRVEQVVAKTLGQGLASRPAFGNFVRTRHE